MTNNFFFEKSHIQFRLSSLWLFLLFSGLAWGINFLGRSLFPASDTGDLAYLGRHILAIIAVFFLLAATNWLLKRDGFDLRVLELNFSTGKFLNFLFGSFLALVIIFSAGALLMLINPFHFTTGNLKVVDAFKNFNITFWDAFLEELTFRGYPLIFITQRIGWHKAIWILALPFALPHIPGIADGMQAISLLISTFVFSFLFCYAFILTGTLWTAIGLHFTINMLLHSISGLDGAGNAMFLPIFENEWPKDYNLGATILLVVTVITAILVRKRLNRRFLEYNL